MDTGKPDLLYSRVLGTLTRLIPQDRRKALARFVGGKRMVGGADVGTQRCVWKLESPEHFVDDVSQPKWQAHGIDGVPYTDEVDDGFSREAESTDLHRKPPECAGIWCSGSLEPSGEPGLILLPIYLVCRADAAPERIVRRILGLRDVENAACRDQPRERAHGKCAAAETKEKDPVARHVHARELAVELLHVAAQPPAGCAAHHPQPLQRLGADAIVIDGDLLQRPGLGAVFARIDRFEDLEDVGSTALNGRVPGSIGADDDVLRHVSR